MTLFTNVCGARIKTDEEARARERERERERDQSKGIQRLHSEASHLSVSGRARNLQGLTILNLLWAIGHDSLCPTYYALWFNLLYVNV